MKIIIIMFSLLTWFGCSGRTGGDPVPPCEIRLSANEVYLGPSHSFSSSAFVEVESSYKFYAESEDTDIAKVIEQDNGVMISAGAWGETDITIRCGYSDKKIRVYVQDYL